LAPGRLKSDRRDARILSEVSCRIHLPTVHVLLRRGLGPCRVARAPDAYDDITSINEHN
jgi:hypothetical protein